jgi:hypothetical protein
MLWAQENNMSIIDMFFPQHLARVRPRESIDNFASETI